MKYSFVIPSIGRKEDLSSCVASIEKACKYVKEIDIEVIIVTNKDSDYLSIKAQHPKIVSLFNLEKKGNSKARNFGASKSTGDYIVFMDDDSSISENFLNVLSQSVAGKNVKVFVPKVLDPTTKELFNGVIGEKYLTRFDYSSFKGAVLVIGRDVFQRVGLFDEDFGLSSKYLAGEESDLFFRIKMANEPIMCLPNLIAFHPVNYRGAFEPDPAVLKKRVFNYSYAVGAMIMKSCMLDKIYSFVYLFILFRILLKSMVRTIQNILFPGYLKEKNKWWQYGSVFRGTISGACAYFKSR